MNRRAEPHSPKPPFLPAVRLFVIQMFSLSFTAAAPLRVPACQCSFRLARADAEGPGDRDVPSRESCGQTHLRHVMNIFTLCVRST